ncbi:hypothetical protein ACJ6WF_16015 [Streptomyces sp. MMS24-I2-30]|uniref:hypothetical protein n=1 Tax=Streptomyces sp. MMS24-I2-30 TaxID=3351564 RepID=UPI003896E7F4
MILFEAIGTLTSLGRAFLAWLAVLAAAATIVLLAGTALGAWAVRGLWRHVVRPSWAHGRLHARIIARTRVRASQGRTEPHGPRSHR